MASTSTAKGAAPRPIPPSLRPFLYLGVPRSVLSWQPRLPSRNVSLFLLTVSTLSYLYYDDRRQCKHLKESYIARVKHLAQEPLHSYEYPRKIAVYGAMWPGDDDYDKSTLFFRRYIRPILVAAAIDWEVLHGTRPGGLARDTASRIFARRRQLAGLEPWTDDLSQSKDNTPIVQQVQEASPFRLSPEKQLERELNGAIVILGRPALKEWAYGMKVGWSSTLPLERVDMDYQLASALTDWPEEEPEPAHTPNIGSLDDDNDASEDGAPLNSALNPGRAAFAGGVPQGALFPSPFVPSQSSSSSRTASAANNSSSSDDEFDAILHPVRAALARGINPALLQPPAQIPAQAPLVFVDHENLVGWRTIPRRIVGFFRHRDRVRIGGEAALRIALGAKENARAFDFPAHQDSVQDDTDSLPLFPLTSENRSEPVAPPAPQGGDLDWGAQREESYPAYFDKTLQYIAKSRQQWNDALPKKLEDTRSLESGRREPSRSERGQYRPKTEHELKQERLAKEVEWRAEEHAFGLQRRESGVLWSPRWVGALRVMPEVEQLPPSPEPPAAESEASPST
ncbi:hypothetical protein V8E36_009389 [Tilletia maclaganii]